MAERTDYRCPLCSARHLLYDGIVRWRSGTRPPRSLARPRRQLGVSPRADYDESAYYHCAACGAEFVDHLISSHDPVRLQPTGDGPVFVYDQAKDTWQEQRR